METKTPELEERREALEHLKDSRGYPILQDLLRDLLFQSQRSLEAGETAVELYRSQGAIKAFSAALTKVDDHIRYLTVLMEVEPETEPDYAGE